MKSEQDLRLGQRNHRAGGSQNVIVILAPMSAQNYSVTTSMNSDAASGTDTRPVSGIGQVPPALWEESHETID